ncbi:MAG TPA: TlpA disulfide reductase family protein [Ktedonobacteraceae bacterium]|nr:TlpA disulfide reductase family protein [Ktedonobacteraceae bacterium]
MEIDDTTLKQIDGQEPMAEAEVIRRRKRKRSIIIFVVVSIINAGLLTLLWVQLLTPAHPVPSNADTTVNYGTDDGLQDPMVGKSAPDFALPLLGSNAAQTLRLAGLKGKPVVINVWNSTCAPCMDEAGLLQKEWQHVQAKGVVFVGIDFLDSQSSGMDYLHKYGITYQNVIDTDGSVGVSYGVSGTPETIFINSHGVIIRKVAHELTEKALLYDLQQLT